MPRSAAEERGGNNKFLKWRSKKKEFMLHYARGNTERAWDELRKLMLYTNRNFQQIQEDQRAIESKDAFRI